MKRFYKTATPRRTDAGWQIELDGRPVRTPKRAALVLPSQALAEAAAEEWNAQGDLVDPASLPLTGIANAAVDHVAADRAAFASGIAAYAETDLLLFRAESPQTLVKRQAESWDPLLRWAERRYDVAFAPTTGLMPVPQPGRTREVLSAALDAADDFALAAAQPVVTITGSLIVTLALIEGEIDDEAAFRAGELDALYQLEEWGRDAEAEAVLDRRRHELGVAAKFLSLR